MLWNEKEVEESLVTESRELAGPDGLAFSHADFRLYWDIYDYMTDVAQVDGAEIVGMALKWIGLEQVSFGDAFRGVLQEMDNQRREIWGVL